MFPNRGRVIETYVWGREVACSISGWQTRYFFEGHGFTNQLLITKITLVMVKNDFLLLIIIFIMLICVLSQKMF